MKVVLSAVLVMTVTVVLVLRMVTVEVVMVILSFGISCDGRVYGGSGSLIMLARVETVP